MEVHDELCEGQVPEAGLCEGQVHDSLPAVRSPLVPENLS